MHQDSSPTATHSRFRSTCIAEIGAPKRTTGVSSRTMCAHRPHARTMTRALIRDVNHATSISSLPLSMTLKKTALPHDRAITRLEEPETRISIFQHRVVTGAVYWSLIRPTTSFRGLRRPTRWKFLPGESGYFHRILSKVRTTRVPWYLWLIFVCFG